MASMVLPSGRMLAVDDRVWGSLQKMAALLPGLFSAALLEHIEEKMAFGEEAPVDSKKEVKEDVIGKSPFRFDLPISLASSQMAPWYCHAPEGQLQHHYKPTCPSCFSRSLCYFLRHSSQAPLDDSRGS